MAALFWVKPQALRFNAMLFACAPKCTVAGSVSLSGPSTDAGKVVPDPQMKALLTESSDLLRPVLFGLPPDRAVGHKMPLLQGLAPLFKRTYRLSPLNWLEIKLQLAELLAEVRVPPPENPAQLF
jgi:hypothetical protein